MRALFYVSRSDYNGLGWRAFLFTTTSNTESVTTALHIFRMLFQSEFGKPLGVPLRLLNCKFICHTGNEVWEELA